MKEIWKSIKGYEGIYEISNTGKIKSLKRKMVIDDTILKLYNKEGYLIATLSKNKTEKLYPLHRLLYSHFKGDLIKGLVIDHIDYNKLNNRLDNLQQITIRENCSKDKWRAKTTSKCLGVSWCKFKNRWRACIYVDGKQKLIGYYKSEIEASNAYQNKLSDLIQLLEHGNL